MQSDGVAIRVNDLKKSFRIPTHRVHTLKERALHPLRRMSYNHLQALQDINFEVLQGEFFGIVGRNGSGKSTLLKCLAGIYKADAGTMQVAGRLAPFIELGVGFNPDLPARDNVIINAVMMGLSPAEAERRFEEIIAFGELEGFVDLKLKNYSSGMQVRLAFSVMVHTDPDVMLVDEVLAVGDAAFQQKCVDVFYRLRAEGKTVVLVTHAMGLVEQFCHRAMLISDSRIKGIGDPGEIARAYLSENFAGVSDVARTPGGGDRIRLLDTWVSDEQGQRIDAVAHMAPMRIHVVLEARTRIDSPSISLFLTNEDGVHVFAVGADEDGAPLSALDQGERVEFSVECENRLGAGRYYIGCSVTQGTAGLEVLFHQERTGDMLSYGMELFGIFTIDNTPTFTRLGAGEPVAMTSQPDGEQIR
jgi:ABC-type polysaccharide/polyol phosphate transport system ATPase subunit